MTIRFSVRLAAFVTLAGVLLLGSFATGGEGPPGQTALDLRGPDPP